MLASLIDFRAESLLWDGADECLVELTVGDCTRGRGKDSIVFATVGEGVLPGMYTAECKASRLDNDARLGDDARVVLVSEGALIDVDEGTAGLEDGRSGV